MEQDDRDPFHGPPAIGEILDQVLRADPAKRFTAAQVVDALALVKDRDVR